MKVLGLVSGGKDSVYNLLVCRKYGHEIVALGNLLPVEDTTDELDSFMYQTVGHQLVEAYAECIDLPLFRRRIAGTSKQVELEYSFTNGDEVEDLMSLISFAKERLPAIEAVSSGAIASDYQRLRVENVCSRLGLVSLAYLWMQPQHDLLQGMIDAGIIAILVKVAALGLQPDQHLGKSLQEMQPILHTLNRQFGCNICGEGGEYETLTLDCPLFVQGRIELTAWTCVLHSPDLFASVGVLHPTRFQVVPKLLRGPSHPVILEVPSSYAASSLVNSKGLESLDGARHDATDATAQFQRSGDFLFASCAPTITAAGPAGQQVSEAALHRALRAVQQGLAERAATLDHAVLTHIYLRDMSHFAAVNAVYKQYFPMVKPAARACVQVPLPADLALIVEVLVATTGLAQRRVLHVQSISRWAPSCIGPYSQAVSVPGLLFFAGQIGLHPPTMELLPSLDSQVQQSFSSCQAVSTAMRTCLASSLLAVTLYSTPDAGLLGRTTLQSGLTRMLTEKPSPEPEQDEEAACKDAYLHVAPQPRGWQPLTTFLVVPALPKAAAVEIQPLAASDTCFSGSDDSNSRPGRRIGWVDRLLNEEAFFSQMAMRALLSTGRFCCCHVSILAEEQLGKVLMQQSYGLSGAVKQLLEAAQSKLASARLSVGDIVWIRLYFQVGALMKCAEADELQEVVSVLRFELTRCSIDACIAAPVPVLAVGPSAEVQAILHLELLAWKH